MPLVTYSETRPWAAGIQKETQARVMPPWFADPRFGHFANDPSLTAQQIATLAGWASNQAPPGDPREAPQPQHWAEDWNIPQPDLVVYLQTPTDVLLRRLRARRADPESPSLEPDPDYLKELNEAYHHFFFHYTATPLLVVETSQFDSDASDEALDDLVRQIRGMGPGTRYYVPRIKT